MADSSSVQGFKCQFIDSVPEDFYCKLCTLVARELSFTSCCGESFCNACILAIQKDNKPCPECGDKEFQISGQKKYQKKIASFQVYCLLKEKGCGWSGRLEELDAHIDTVNGECEYMDVSCPLKCDQKVGKKNLQEHVTNECVKRDFVCPYCSFKAIYEIVANIHWPECSYYPLPCPNRCGVTCERPTMEDHIKICPLQEVECQFQHVGCEVKFCREKEEKHMREKSQDHLAMMAASFVKLEKSFQARFLEQDQKMKAREQEFEKEREALKEVTLKYEERIIAQEEKLENLRKGQEKALKEAEKTYDELLKTALTEEQEQQKIELKETSRKNDEKIRTQEITFKMELALQNEKMKNVSEKYEKKVKAQEELLQKLQEEVDTERKMKQKDYDDLKSTTERNQQAIKEQQNKMKLEIAKNKKEWRETGERKLAENTTVLEKLQRSYFAHREFTIENFQVKKVDPSMKRMAQSYWSLHMYHKQHWRSPAMYTHLYGYKFCIGIDPIVHDETTPWTKASISLRALNEEYDDRLSWPARAEFTIELINHYENGQNKRYTEIIEWGKKQSIIIGTIEYNELSLNKAQKTLFLFKNNLYFKILDIKVLS